MVPSVTLQSLVPLQFGVPGGPELVIVLLSMLFWLVPLAAVILIVYSLRRIDRNVGRLVELQEE